MRIKRLVVIKFLKANRLWVATILWLFVVVFVPMVHHEDPVYNRVPIIVLLEWIPIAVLLALLAYEIAPNAGVWNIFSYKIWTRVIVVGIISMIIYAICLSAINGRLMWAESTSLITGGLVMLLMMRRFRYLEEVRSVLLSILAGFFILGLYEFIYSITGSLFLHEQGFHGAGLVKPCAIIFVPFCIAALYYRIKPTKFTWIFFAIWILLWVIWIVPGERWDIYAWTNGQMVIHHPINWPVYQLSKVIKLAFIPVVYSLTGGRAKSLDRF